ncbi:maltokinase N-terminal cap-like domain-containing protein [Streptomyces liangshanensis]|uniref:1,4-alpha-glucan branching protein n=1 Tax=Streptomyces liangshanensis TaxID=2717324 RepID=A0A6G9H753_9ACTN|nr:1,4-alpha-glucan branching protein [Streptomyces liangshanensis]QIQ06136.1 1,4-alpha-glucan branching protein [Streptomyces liangshanensis]
MAIIHQVTLKPTKLELLAGWLPAQPWYAGTGDAAALAKAGGFRLDDPEGAVGIEFMVVTDRSGDEPVSYQVPLSYRGAPLDGAEHALVGTTEHEVLGRRWVYDGTHDPVLVAQLLALVGGEAQAQAQSVNETPDPTVTAFFAGSGGLGAIRSTSVTDGTYSTRLLVRTDGDGPDTTLTVRVHRVLRPGEGDAAARAGHALGYVSAPWLLPDGTTARDLFAVVESGA